MVQWCPISLIVRQHTCRLLILLAKDCTPLSGFEYESLPLCPVTVSTNNIAIISIMTILGSRSSSRALRCNWRGTSELNERHFSFVKIASVLGTVNWGAEKWCDNSAAWFGRGNGLKVTFWRIRRHEYISLLSPLSFTQWHEMNWWDRGRGKCRCKCLLLKWSCLLVHLDWLMGERRKLEWGCGAAFRVISWPKPLIAAATMEA